MPSKKGNQAKQQRGAPKGSKKKRNRPPTKVGGTFFEAAPRKAARKTEVEEEQEDIEDDDEESEEEEEEQPKAVKTKARRFEEASQVDEVDEADEPRGVIYLGHIPKGFFEPQMRTFFGQFGKVTRLRLSRSKKNAQSKGFAFIEFREESVAKIVADTMDGYLLFGKKLKCHMMDPDKQHPALFKNCKKKMINYEGRRRRKERRAYNDRPTVKVDGEDVPKATKRQVVKRKQRNNKLKAMLDNLGVEFDLGDAAGGGGAKSTPAAKEDAELSIAKVKAAAVVAAASASNISAASKKKKAAASEDQAAAPAKKRRKKL